MTSALRGEGVPSKADIVVSNLSKGGCVNLRTWGGKKSILRMSYMEYLEASKGEMEEMEEGEEKDANLPFPPLLSENIKFNVGITERTSMKRSYRSAGKS